jgi:hypothetical protein
MNRITTTTPKGMEGFNISFSDEMKCGKELLAVLPKGWNIHFNWMQILFSDVQYEFDSDKKIIEIIYNQNLCHWWKELVEEIKVKIAE